MKKRFRIIKIPMPKPIFINKTKVPASYLNFLITNKKKVLRGLMWKNFVHISIEANTSIKRDQYRFFNVKDGKDVTNKVDIV